MIKIPAFFVKGDTLTSGPYTGKRVWWISDTASPGFVRHPAFWSGGSPIAQIWVGKYQAVADGSKLGSLPGLYPIADLDFATMRSRASARNTGSVTGFTIWSYHQISAIQLLLIVELGTPDAQNVLGQGNSTADFGPLQVNNATVAQATWRGIVGLWANVWQMADGLSSSSSMGCMIWDNSGNSSYVGTSLTLPVSGYPTAFSAATGTGYDLRTSFVPSSTSATQTDGATGDRYSAGASAVLYFGGSYGGGAQCGPFYLNLSTDASYSAGNVSSRIAKT
jgi:hypothetical protein